MNNYLYNRRNSFRGDLILSILYIVANDISVGDDSNIINDLESRGHTINLLEDSSATGSEGYGNDVILISGTIDTGVLSAEFNTSSFPVVHMKGEIWNNNDLCATTGLDGGETLWDVKNSSHIIASYWGYSGTNLPCFSTSGAYRYTSDLAASALEVMDGENPTTTNIIVFTYDSGDTMKNGHVAEARRAGYGPISSDYVQLEPEAFDILESTLLWAAGKI